jgi:hypothetical protein
MHAADLQHSVNVLLVLGSRASEGRITSTSSVGWKTANLAAPPDQERDLAIVPYQRMKV